MTCIVAIETNRGTTIGADTLGSTSWTGVDYDRDKIFTNGDMVFAGSGSYREGDVIEYALDPPVHHPADKADARYLVADVVPAMIRALESGRCLITDKGVAEMESDFVVAYHGRAYIVFSNFCVLRPMPIAPHDCRVSVLGSGGEPAWSVVHDALNNAMEGSLYDNEFIADVIRSAIRTVSRRVLSVNDRIQIVHQAKPEK